MGRTARGVIPIGVVTVAFRQHPNLRRQAEPHVYWFPEATGRNKIEATLKFIVDLKADHLVIVIAKPADWRFFDHLCKYGALRRVGTIRGFLASGESVGYYQGVS